MFTKSLLCTAAVVGGLLLDGIVDARRLFGQPRRDYYERAELETKLRNREKPQKLDARSRTSNFRFFNNNSARTLILERLDVNTDYGNKLITSPSFQR